MDSIYDQYWLVTVPVVIASGIVGTGLMTLYMHAMTLITGRVMKLTKILGTMLTFTTNSENKLKDAPYAIVVGVLVQYVIGILFMTAYFLLWKYGIGGPYFFDGIVVSIVSGLFTIAFWYALFTFHPNPPDISLKPYLFTLFTAHFVFVSGCFVTFNFLVSFK